MSRRQEGTHIQPIPPPLEFPFPRPGEPRHESVNPLEDFGGGLSKTSSNPLESRNKSRPIKQRSTTTTTNWPGNRTQSFKQGGRTTGKKLNSDADPYGRFAVGNDSYTTKGKVDKSSGRLNISVNETANRGYLAKALFASLNHHLLPKSGLHDQSHQRQPNSTQDSGLRRPDLGTRLSTTLGLPSLDESSSIPVLNVVIMVIGSRGDIQPFLKIGKLLKENYGHNVRIATHPAFKKFVEEDCGLSFFSVGGDPSELMAFMVKNPGLIPSVSTIRAGEIGRRRDTMFEMFQGFWRACINATDDETNTSNLRMMGKKKPFVADAIIANPPSFAHIHCAEALGIPLHLMFTFPYSPTQQFPHPLANIKTTNVDPGYTNFMSYPLVEMMTWQGLGDLVNRFRVKTLGLEPVSTLWAPGQLFRLKVPYTYLWSPGLIPKPADWGSEIDIAGFVFLDLASSFIPPASLSKFLDEGEPPVYIGFGSIVVDDPDQFTELIFEAVKQAGVRALVSKGWGGLGEGNTPDTVYMLENTPHDWLFPRVRAAVHHGGAGTTAIGLKCGKPTMIVPFFGDQPFWGAMVAKAGAGADSAIPYKRLTAEALANGIRQCLSPEAKRNAEQIAHDIEAEGDGAENAVKAFHRHLPLFGGENTIRCSIFQDRVAVWAVKDTRLTLSCLAAELLTKKGKLKWHDLRLTRHCEWNDFEGPGEPITGGGAALAKSFGDIAKGVGGIPVKWVKSVKKHEQHQEEQERRRDSTVPSDNRDDIQTQSSKTRSPDSGSPNRQSKAYEEKGELSEGGQHGAEKHLPEPNSLGVIANDFEANENADGDTFGRLRNNTEIASLASSNNSSVENIAQELAEKTGKGFAKSGQALAKVPMDLSLAIAQGFHNAPRLYGDTTVRPTARVTGFHSGLRAAGEELVFGVYDGVTGLVLQPYHGAKLRGTLGFLTGLGKGLGGFVLKDFSALIAPVAYTSKGIHKELTKGRQPTAFVRRARIYQGRKESEALDEGARKRDEKQVEVAWKYVREIMEELERNGKEGLRGRIRRRWEIRKLDRQGAFKGSVWSAKKVVEERQKSRFIEEDKILKADIEKKARQQYIAGTSGRGKSRMIWFKRGRRDDQANGHTEQTPTQNDTTDRHFDQGTPSS